ncbi:MAG: hypothetical protein Q7U40_12010, partial [Desulfatirhabdiaceae bacterium]|nr:hypothetical protein [Desulfatirhabdiaceae bacterium]
SPENALAFETLMSGHPFACIGKTTEEAGELEIRKGLAAPLLAVSITELKAAWKKPFGALI